MKKLCRTLLSCIAVALCQDAGAATLTVTNLNDSGPGSLRQRIVSAAAGDTIGFTVSGTITLTSGQITLNKNLTINGPGAPLLTISGNNTSRIFRVVGAVANISGLTLTGGRTENGGAIAINDSTVNLSNCLLFNNAALLRGGAISVSGALNLSNCNLFANSAGSDGGAVGIQSGQARLNGCTVSGNSAGNGGGLAIQQQGGLSSTNCTISGNTATTNGGGIFVAIATTITIHNCTITGNTANGGGGLWRDSRGGGLRNTIVAGNTAPVGPDIRSFFGFSLGNNLIGKSGGSVGLTNGINGDKVGTIASPLDPKLGPLQNNGGPTLTHALLPGSPAIDMGNPIGTPPTDQRGFTRVVDGDKNGSAIIDIGAFEFSNRPPFALGATVTGNEDTDLVIILAGFDLDGHPLTAKISSLPSLGVLYQFVSGGPGGPIRGSRITTVPTTLADPIRRVIYAPNNNGNGTPFDSFLFVVNDGIDDSGAAIVTINIRPVNDPPVAEAGPDQEEVVGDLVSFTGSFTDPDSADTHIIAWDFGDGTSASPSTLTPTHIYSQHGLYTVTLTVTDDKGAVGTDTLTLTLISPLGFLEETVNKLIPHERTAGQIKEALKKVSKALDREWIDEVHLSAKDGEKVFQDFKEAVEQLTKLPKAKGKKGGLSPETLAAVECAIDNLVKAARLLAQTLLLEVDGMVAVDPSRQDKVDKELAKAHEEFEDAEAEGHSGDFVNAIESYEKAWKHTTHAEEEATRTR